MINHRWIADGGVPMTTVEQTEAALIEGHEPSSPSCANERTRLRPGAGCGRRTSASSSSGFPEDGQATRNGGYGLGMHAHLDTISSLAGMRLDGLGGRRRARPLVALLPLPRGGQDDIYGATRLRGGSRDRPPRTVTRHDDGCHVLSGFWPFASGNEDAAWALLGAIVSDD